MQTRLGLDEILNQTPLVNGMVVPDQNDGTRDATQDLLEKEDHVFTAQIGLKGSHRQLHFSSTWTDQESSQQVQTLMVRQAGTHVRGLSTRCPAAAQRRNQ